MTANKHTITRLMLLFFVTTAIAHPQTLSPTTPGTNDTLPPLTPPQNPCDIPGDPDTYGLGVRLGTYLQWVATYISTTAALDAAATIRSANTLFLLANLIGLFVLTFHRETVYAVEPLIVIFIVFGAAWILVLVVFDIKSGINEAILRVVLYSILVGYMVWYFWVGIDGMTPSPCGTDVFLFVKTDLFGWFRTVGKVIGVIAAVAFVALWALHMPDLLWGRYPALHEVWDRRERMERLRRSGLGFVVIVLSITGAELMISWNSLEGVGQVDSTGQLIPVILGGGLLWATLLEWMRTDERIQPLLGLPKLVPMFALFIVFWVVGLLNIDKLMRRGQGRFAGHESREPEHRRPYRGYRFIRKGADTQDRLPLTSLELS
jgi:hypothetical protein